MKTPKQLDAIVDKVLAYRPTARSKLKPKAQNDEQAPSVQSTPSPVGG